VTHQDHRRGRGSLARYRRGLGFGGGHSASAAAPAGELFKADLQVKPITSIPLAGMTFYYFSARNNGIAMPFNVKASGTCWYPSFGAGQGPIAEGTIKRARPVRW